MCLGLASRRAAELACSMLYERFRLVSPAVRLGRDVQDADSVPPSDCAERSTASSWLPSWATGSQAMPRHSHVGSSVSAVQPGPTGWYVKAAAKESRSSALGAPAGAPQLRLSVAGSEEQATIGQVCTLSQRRQAAGCQGQEHGWQHHQGLVQGPCCSDGKTREVFRPAGPVITASSSLGLPLAPQFMNCWASGFEACRAVHRLCIALCTRASFAHRPLDGMRAATLHSHELLASRLAGSPHHQLRLLPAAKRQKLQPLCATESEAHLIRQRRTHGICWARELSACRSHSHKSSRGEVCWTGQHLRQGQDQDAVPARRGGGRQDGDLRQADRLVPGKAGQGVAQAALLQQAVADVAAKVSLLWAVSLCWLCHLTAATCSVMDRIQQRAKETPDPAETLQLRKLGRKLTAVNEELADYNDKIQLFTRSPEREWEALVLKHQTSLTSEFFLHIGRMVQAAANDPRRREGWPALLCRCTLWATC